MDVSRAPEVVDGLLAMLAGLDGVTVYDGPYLTGDVPAASVHVGYDADPEGNGEAWTSTMRQTGYASSEEDIVLGCAVHVFGEGQDPTRSLRTRAYAVLNAALARVRANPTLDRPGLQAGGLIDSRFHYVSDVEAWLPFRVSVKALL